MIDYGVEDAHILFEQVVENGGISTHGVISVWSTEGITQTYEQIVIRDLTWEKQPGGTWGSSKPVTYPVGITSPNSLEYYFNDLQIQGKVGTVLYANQPTDIYWMSSGGQSGPIYLNPETCLPVLISTSDDRIKKTTTLTYEWNIPLKITPPGP
jgi:hypothetical protein